VEGTTSGPVSGTNLNFPERTEDNEQSAAK